MRATSSRCALQLLLLLLLCTVTVTAAGGGRDGVASATDGVVRTKVFIDVDYRHRFIGRIVIGLYDDDLPRTVENFKQLCVAKTGYNYRGTPFHRIMRNHFIIGGEVKRSVDGTGGWSIYGRQFDDESYKYKHVPGAVAMVNFRRNGNASQFSIMLDEMPYLDGKQVVFGKVLQGLEVVRKISKGRTAMHYKAIDPAYISNCGILA